MGTGDSDEELYLGLVVFLLEKGMVLPPGHRQRAAQIAKRLLNSADYLQRWKNPDERKRVLKSELGMLGGVGVSASKRAAKDLASAAREIIRWYDDPELRDNTDYAKWDLREALQNSKNADPNLVSLCQSVENWAFDPDLFNRTDIPLEKLRDYFSQPKNPLLQKKN
jgi:hypothetical protein